MSCPGWADAVLCTDGPVRTLAGLWLAPEYRRGHGALYEAVNHGRIDIGRRRRSLAGWLYHGPSLTGWCWPPLSELGAATSPQRLFCPVYGRGKGQAQMIPGWPGSALEPGRTRIQHLDLDTRIVRLPARIDRIARRASRGHTADVPGVLRSAMHAGSEIAGLSVGRPIPCGLLNGGPMSPAAIRCALGDSGTIDH